MIFMGTHAPACRPSRARFSKNTSTGVRQSRHFLGRMLILARTASKMPVGGLLRPIFLEKYQRSRPFAFSLAPRCQGD